MRVGATVARALSIDSTEIVVQERARRGLENVSLASLVFFQIFSHESLHGEPQVTGEALYIPGFQQRSHDLAAISAVTTIDLAGYVLVQLINNGIEFFDRQITGLQKTPEGPVGIFFLFCQYRDSLGVCLNSHVVL
jgi:hypothetical protein